MDATATHAESALIFALKHMTKEGLVTMSLLLLMSLASWTVIIGKALGLRKQRRLAQRFHAAFESSADPLELVDRDKDFEGAPPYSVYDNACRELLKQLERFAPARAANGSRRA